MSEVKDPAIKLFGKTIQLPDVPMTAPAETSECGEDAPARSLDTSVGDASIQHRPCPCSPNSSPEDTSFNRSEAEQDVDKDSLGASGDNGKAEDVVGSMMSEELTEPNVVKKNSGAASADNVAVSAKASKTEEEQNETGNTQDKTPKKPDKILPCPRCNSMDTKFCYYNNYNVNQPRHFCKNCQRYWTAGGTMRNVPVGAGRRKNKNSISQYRHITVSETLHTARPDVPNGIHHPALKPNGTVLTFGSDAPLCESMASVLNIAEKTVRNCTRNGFHNGEELRAPNPYGTGGNGDENSSGSSLTVSNSKDEMGKDGLSDNPATNCHSIPPQIPCFPGAPWPYPWNSFQWSSPAPPAAAFCPGSFPMPFYPAAPYWGCTLPGTWNVPWVNPSAASQSHGNPTSSGPNSPTLGKHSRDDNVQKSFEFENEESQKESNPEKCLWVPKTLRIDDPGEAARSSIWATLGIKNDKLDPSSGGGGGLFKAFQSKGDGKTNNVAETSTVLQANPAAMSRSLNFHESS